jgi:hypothetical protein
MTNHAFAPPVAGLFFWPALVPALGGSDPWWEGFAPVISRRARQFARGYIREDRSWRRQLHQRNTWEPITAAKINRPIAMLIAPSFYGASSDSEPIRLSLAALSLSRVASARVSSARLCQC